VGRTTGTTGASRWRSIAGGDRPTEIRTLASSRGKGESVTAGPYPTIVLVHGAFADASSFRGLYDELLDDEVTMIACRIRCAA
jgi:hypothetical protein